MGYDFEPSLGIYDTFHVRACVYIHKYTYSMSHTHEHVIDTCAPNAASTIPNPMYNRISCVLRCMLKRFLKSEYCSVGWRGLISYTHAHTHTHMPRSTSKHVSFVRMDGLTCAHTKTETKTHTVCFFMGEHIFVHTCTFSSSCREPRDLRHRDQRSRTFVHACVLVSNGEDV